MAAFTSNATGNWSASGQTTWAEAGVPGNGDTVTIATGHTITVDANTTVGNSPAAGNTVLTINGALVVSASVTLTVRGDTSITTAKTITVNAGGTWKFDATAAAAPTTTFYKVLLNGSGTFAANGSSGTRCTITSDVTGGAATGYFTRVSSSSGLVTIAYTDCTNLGNSSTTVKYSFSLWPGSAQTVSFDNCAFSNCGGIYIESLAATGILTITNNAFTSSPTSARYALNVQQTAPTTGTRTITGNVIDRPVVFGTPAGMTVTNNVIYSVDTTYAPLTLTAGAAPADFSGNLIYADAHADVMALNSLGTYANNYFISNRTTNPHFVGGTTASAGTVTLEGNIFEHLGTDGTGDCILPQAAAGVASTWDVKQNIVLPNAGGVTSGALLTYLRANTASLTISITRNTYFMGAQGVKIWEGGYTRTGLLSRFANNLAWDTSERGFLLYHSDAATQESEFTGTADAGSDADTLVDAANTFPDFTTLGTWYLKMTSGANNGLSRLVSGWTSASTISCSAFPNVISAGDTFALIPIDIGDPADLDYNGAWNHDPTTTLYDGAGLNAAAATGGYHMLAVSAALGVHDVNADPDFVDSARDLAAWDTALGGAGTAANALTELRKRNSAGYDTDYNVAALVAWVKEGFGPTNSLLRAAGDPGDGSPDIGAVDYAGPTGSPWYYFAQMEA